MYNEGHLSQIYTALTLVKMDDREDFEAFAAHPETPFSVMKTMKLISTGPTSLSHLLLQNREQEKLSDHLILHHNSHHRTHQASVLRVELEEIQHEALLLQQLQHHMSADLADLWAI